MLKTLISKDHIKVGIEGVDDDDYTVVQNKVNNWINDMETKIGTRFTPSRIEPVSTRSWIVEAWEGYCQYLTASTTFKPVAFRSDFTEHTYLRVILRSTEGRRVRICHRVSVLPYDGARPQVWAAAISLLVARLHAGTATWLRELN
eukprot:GHVU01092161.1.p1 GENE.GHVU01092161.1~~GHVU01092161.1.p1  ORF type:complete len:146 (+),score=13.07 GHVU01092161.1:1123-1560(+)